jgi:alkylation response protein AidB-like acyl-CoA dehydrogenase
MSTAYRPPVEDLRFVLHRVLDVARLGRTARHAGFDREIVDHVLEAGARFASEIVAPLNEVADREGCRLENGRVRMPAGFREAYARYVEAGWPRLSLPVESGGQGLPLVLQTAFGEGIIGACLAFSMVPCPSRAAAITLIAAGAPWMREVAVPRLVSGEWAGVICMTEPNAGSDVGAAVVKAERRGDGSYALAGTKIFISGADHDLTEQIVYLALARVPGAPPGTRGLSLFVVPTRRIGPDGALGPRNDIRIARIENKMGLHGSPTCVVEFAGAEAHLVGAENEGIRNIFHMVNVMRLEVASQGPALGGAALARAFAYAASRVQGGRPIGEHPDVRRMLLVMKAWVEGVRALVLETALALDLAAAAPEATERQAALDLAEWLLPICKTIGSEMAIEVANLAIQVHGGHGYVRETGVEQIARDARILPIYEGTSGIQAIDTLTRKLARDDGRRYRVFAERIAADLRALAGRGDLAPIRDAVTAGLAVLENATRDIAAALDAAPRDALAGASAYQRLAAIVAIGWMWLRAAAVDETGDKRAAAAVFAERVMPAAAALAAEARAGARSLFALPLAETAPR